MAIKYFKTKDGDMITSKNPIDSKTFENKYEEVDANGKSLTVKAAPKKPAKKKIAKK